MNVLYDISLLGLGYHDRRARTGIFRAIDQIIVHLSRSPDCQLSFCASQWMGILSDPRRYLAEQPALQQSQWQGVGGLRRSTYDLLWQAMTQLGFAPDLSLPQRMLRKSLYLFAQWWVNQTATLTTATLATYDIFQSSYHAIPKAVQRAKHLQRFAMIYDLIPILFPQYVATHDRVLHQTLQSLSTEDWIICISQSTRNDLLNYWPELHPDRVFVAHLAASDLFYPCWDDWQKARVRQKYGIPQEATYILSVGTLEPRKNIVHLVRCFAQLVQQQRLDDLYLVLVGVKGWKYEAIFQEISTRFALPALQQRVIVTGYVEDADLAPLYSAARFFVYPSLYEGFGLPPLEAMQCGVPVITANTSSLPEVVGDAGLLVEPTDADALCQAMLQLCRGDELQRELAVRSRVRAGEFSWQKCTAEIIGAYKLACGRELVGWKNSKPR